jgi:pimeloyl-ACP methyl ester carboxylesterase
MRLTFNSLSIAVLLSVVGSLHAKNDSLTKHYDYDHQGHCLGINTGSALVGTDNAGNPVQLGYKTQGVNDGRPVILLVDHYLGINSWKHVQKKLSKNGYYTIAFDNLGFGTSSKNEPTDLDGVAGHTGYSYRQQAYFMHEMLKVLDPKGPIVFVAVDTQAQVGSWYITDYNNDSYPFTKMFMEDSSHEAMTSDDPCSLAYLNIATAQQLAAYYALDPRGATIATLGETFLTTNCPSIQPILAEICADYASTAPASVYARTLTGTFTEDVSPLMKDITIPVLNIYGTTGDNLAVSRRGVGITFFGNSPGYTNPSVQSPTPCTECKPIVEPFPNSRFITFPGHGTIPHLTAYKRFMRVLLEFITGEDAACSIRI